MEVVDKDFQKPELFISKKLKWSEVSGTDAHHPCGVGGQSFPGSMYTWVKMGTPSFDGLRLALIDGFHSIKRSDSITYDPNDRSELAIECISITDAKYIGRDVPFICDFNPWLNTIIGGRGTGKSTILEFSRLAMNRRDDLPVKMSSEFCKYWEVCKNRDDTGLLTSSSVISVYYRKDTSKFRVSWSSDGCFSKIQEEIGDNTWTDTVGDIPQRFPIRIYSQKQIFELATRPQALLKIINEEPEVRYQKWRQEWDRILTQYITAKSKERGILIELSQRPVLVGQLDDVKRKIGVFEAAQKSDVVKNYRLRKDQVTAIEKWERGIDDKSNNHKTFYNHL